MTQAKVHIFPDRVELTTGPGCAFGMFGCPFALVGVFTFVFALVSAEHIEHHSTLERLVAIVFGLVFLFVGLLFSFGKNGVVIDKSNGVIEKWNGLFSFRFTSETFPFEDISRFAIEQKGPREYVVIVEGGTTTVTLLAANSYQTAREQSERIGAYLPFDCQYEVPKGD